MTRVVRPKEFNAVRALPAPQRYEYFVKRVVDSERLWSLRAEDGWVMATDDMGRASFPVWSDAVYAAACATAGWEGSEPSPVPLSEWMEDWLTGLEADGRQVAVFPTEGGSLGAIVEPTRLMRDIQDEERKY